MDGDEQEDHVGAVTTGTGEQVPWSTPRSSARHPLRRPGAGRGLYATGMVLQLLGLLGALSVLLVGVRTDVNASPVPVWAPLTGLLLQLVGQRLCARAWWYVPLRSAQAPPDGVELAFWSVIAVAVAVTGCVVALGPVSSASFSLWSLVVAVGLLALLPAVERPRPEPPAAAVYRSAPLSAAVLVVLGVGVGTRTFDAVAAGAAVAVLGVGLVAQRVWLRRARR